MDSLQTQNALFLPGTIVAIGVIISAVIFYYASTRSKVTQSALEAQQKTIDAQAGRISLLEEQVDCGSKESIAHKDIIDKLSVKVDTLSTIPLAKIEEHMKDTNKILQTMIPMINMNTHTVTDTTMVNQ